MEIFGFDPAVAKPIDKLGSTDFLLDSIVHLGRFRRLLGKRRVARIPIKLWNDGDCDRKRIHRSTTALETRNMSSNVKNHASPAKKSVLMCELGMFIWASDSLKESTIPLGPEI